MNKGWTRDFIHLPIIPCNQARFSAMSGGGLDGLALSASVLVRSDGCCRGIARIAEAGVAGAGQATVVDL
jgi:hypothetical protein